MLQRALSGSGGGGGNVVEDTIASPSSSVDLGFQPKRLFLYFYNIAGNSYQVNYYDSEYKSDKYVVSYFSGSTLTWASMPNSYYGGLADVTSTGFTIFNNTGISDLHYIAEKP